MFSFEKIMKETKQGRIAINNIFIYYNTVTGSQTHVFPVFLTPVNHTPTVKGCSVTPNGVFMRGNGHAIINRTYHKLITRILCDSNSGMSCYIHVHVEL